ATGVRRSAAEAVVSGPTHMGGRTHYRSPQLLVDQAKLIGPRSALLGERTRHQDIRRRPMLFFKYVFLIAGFGALAGAVASAIYDLYREWEHRRRLAALAEGAAKPPAPPPVRWKTAARAAAAGWLAVLAGLSIAVVPSGTAGVRVSQIAGTRPGTLYPGVHFIKPLID